MKKKFERFSLNSRTIRQKLIVGFQLMSILPILVCVYLVSNYVFPKFWLRPEIFIFIIVSVIIALVGLLVIKEVFDRLTSVAAQAKVIAAGDINRQLDISHNDEVGELSKVLNQLTQRIRGNMDELKRYSEKTTEINIEIQKKIIILSNLMQVSTLISQGGKFDDILKVAVEKSRLLANSDSAFLLFKEENKESFTVKVADGSKVDQLSALEFGPQEDIYNKALNLNKLLILDSRNLLSDNLTVDFFTRFQMKNCLAMPIFLRKQVKAVLGVANNRENFGYTKDDIELLEIFSKQIAIAIENDILSHRVEKLEVKDILTGLYNKPFIAGRLQEEIKRAIIYQRPCSFVIFDIDNFKNFRDKSGLIGTEAALKQIALLLQDSITDVDRVGRTDSDEFSLILPERTKRQAYEIAEEIRKKVQLHFAKEGVGNNITFSAGVSENPLDGVEANQLIEKAQALLKKAKANGKNQVAVF